MKKEPITSKIVRIVLGLALILMGLNVFLQFMPMAAMSASATALLGAIMAAGYLMPMIGVFKLIVGLLFIVRKTTAVATLALIPFLFNVLLFHIFLDPASMMMTIVFVLLNGYLVYDNWPKYKKLFD